MVDKVKELAEAATPGPWERLDTEIQAAYHFGLLGLPQSFPGTLNKQLRDARAQLAIARTALERIAAGEIHPTGLPNLAREALKRLG